MKNCVDIDYYTDILCVWAYVAQVKLDELKQEFGEQISINYKFISLFGNNDKRIGEGWSNGGYAGYSAHVKEVAENFPYVTVNDDIWVRNAPPSSIPVHLYLKAIQLLEAKGTIATAQQAELNNLTVFEAFAWRLRLAFFRDAENIGDLRTLNKHASDMGIPTDAIEQEIACGRAYAALSTDIDEKHSCMIEGSPTFIFNEGRQKLYGNIGYRAIAANVREVLEQKIDIPDWC